ncbi:hypothetical protein Hypma_016338 [Hypsizygus marmoreus]|uniref:Uncharacterized protein n=1 Tax=Hypsizygus marmoreus TaxID=39966 RepID=A0A369IXL2_HYPMA|nr:hypothetical protein Hypma_016338 [Hypsizygus marmoreus]
MPPNQHHTEYAPPVIRAPSPASSIGTTYGEDQTSFSDCEEQISQAAFEKKWEDRIGLGKPREEEEWANQEPLLVRPEPRSEEEHRMHERIMICLREAVQSLEDNELFERTMLRGSQAALEPQPSTTDIDTLMRSMMVAPQPSPTDGSDARGRPTHTKQPDVTNGPWTVNGYGGQDRFMKESLFPSEVQTGKRSRNGSRRN